MAGPDAKQVANALLANVLRGEFPDETISQGELTVEGIPTVVKGLEKAVGETKNEIKKLTSSNKAAIDSWVGVAGGVYSDVEKAGDRAKEIVMMEEQEKTLQQKVVDAQSHHTFLLTEIKFTQALARILGSLQLISNTLDQVSVFLREGELTLAVAQVQAAEHALGSLGHAGIIVVGLMKERVGALKRQVIEKVEDYWSEMVTSGSGKDGEDGRWVRVLKEVKTSDGVIVAADMIVEALGALELLKGKVDGLHQMIDRVLIGPRLEVPKGRRAEVPRLVLDEGDARVKIEGTSKDLSAAHLYSDLHMIITLLHSRFPSSLQRSFSRIFTPSLNTRLISQYLSTTIPSALSALPQFQEVLKKTEDFEQFLSGIGWTQELDLQDWVERAAKVWFAKRREDALEATRKAFTKEGWMKGRVVERWETKTTDTAEGVKGGSEDSWEQNWSDDDGENEPKSHSKRRQETTTKGKEKQKNEKKEEKSSLILSGDEEEEDVSGWGLDEDLDLDIDEPPPQTPLTSESEEGKKKEDEGQDDDAPPQIDEMDWGEWAEDDNGGGSIPSKQESSSQQKQETVKKKQSSSLPQTPTSPTKRRKKSTYDSSSKKVTLKETYAVTGMPDAIIDIIQQLLQEAGQLATNPRYTSTPIAPAAKDMLSLPRLILAAYRALAPIYYSVDLASKMYLYNDCIRIEERLKQVAGLANEGSNGKKLFERFTLDKEAAEVVAFGKRQYTRELEAQRMIVRDYLDGTQGLVACTEYPQSETCEAAIKAVVDRVRLLDEKWRVVLSRSVLWQALGNLLGTVCGKIIADVGDMSDISDPESRKLAGLMGQVGELESLFLPASEGQKQEAAAVPCTAVHCGNWLKFRYLESILECTMVELLEMYNAGQLEEFEKEELADLVRALFADTDNRRRCLESIRRGPTGVQD